MHALQVLSKPVIAAISGHAVAGGLELAVWADLRVVEEDAVMGVFCRCEAVPVSVCTFGHLTCHAIPCAITRRWGVPLIDGGTVRLPRLIGMGAAMDLIRTPPDPHAANMQPRCRLTHTHPQSLVAQWTPRRPRPSALPHELCLMVKPVTRLKSLQPALQSCTFAADASVIACLLVSHDACGVGALLLPPQAPDVHAPRPRLCPGAGEWTLQ